MLKSVEPKSRSKLEAEKIKMHTTSQFSNQNQLNQNGFIITLVLLIASIPSAILFAYFGVVNELPQLFIPATTLTATVFIDIFLLRLIRQNQTDTAMFIASGLFILNVTMAMLVVQGLGVIISVSIMLVLLAIVGFALSNNYSTFGVIAALFLGIAAFALDVVLGTNRIAVPQLVLYAPYIAIAIALPIFIVFVREFNRFSLQIKITLGILMTGGIAVATIAIFGLQRAGEIVTTISDRYETSVTSETENQILNRVQVEASNLNKTFVEMMSDATRLANYRTELESQKNSFTSGIYWNATDKLFQLREGQFSNSNADVASVFIPNTIPITEDLLADINTSIYLDFLGPNFLSTFSEVVSVYYISNMGYVVYYPNFTLAGSVSANFDPRQQNAFRIAIPERNPERLPRWTDPYQDPSGAGLITTLSVPVYSEAGEFIGVIGADIQLSKVAQAISQIKLGVTDFAFLVDKNGFIISMPGEGYQIFGLEENRTPTNPISKQSIFDTQSQTLQFAAQRIIINQSTLIDLRINEVDIYLGVAPLSSTEYKLVIFAPANELNGQILASRQEVQNTVEESLESAGFILIGLFIGALLISLLVGQVITRPVKRLTDAVQEIAGGNLTARADIKSQDEAGVLARSFNSMAQTLSDTLTGLEEKVAERTREVEKISENNAYRAAQFESIARISKIISSTQTLDRLLPQIVQTISEEFNFYHVGIFLLDVHKEFAVLAAANSEGGKKMLERNHRLRVGETGLVGYVTRSGQPRVALDVGADAVFFNNPDLPETRSEIALPLRVGVDIFGALDVQSIDTNAFSEEDVNILSVLADQVSIAIQNARLYQQSREALEQAELSAAQMIEQQWSQFLSKQNITQYHFDGVETSKNIKSNDKQSQNLAIPLILRGAKIGTLKLTTADPNRVWDEDEVAIAQATAERTALAIENARLLLEAQKRATKERTIGEVSSKIGNSISLESILKTTIQELSNTLPGAEIAIQFTPDSSEQK